MSSPPPLATASSMSPNGRATLQDVARLAGVSLKTASRVFNSEPHVAAGTAVRVHDAAGRLGFRPNVIARELRLGARSTSVGLVISDVANPFYAAVTGGVERRLRSAGLQLISASSDEDADRERQLTSELLERRVAALMFTTCLDDHSHLVAEQALGLPLVFLDRPPSGVDADVVAIDNEGGARLAAEHLLAHGHRRIALIGDLSRLSTHRERVSGFRDALLAAGVGEWDRYLRADSHDHAAAARAVDDLLDGPQPPTALFTTNNRITVGALYALKARGESDSVALVGFDDFDLADLLDISVVSHDPAAMGRLAADQLVAALGGDTRAQSVRLPVTLVARGSGERPPG